MHHQQLIKCLLTMAARLPQVTGRTVEAPYTVEYFFYQAED